MTDGQFRPAWAEVDLDAIAHNARLLAERCAPAQLCAVVKAGGYGHGAVKVARAALRGGATSLAVALVEEGCQLRQGGIDAPILLLSEPTPAGIAEAVASGLMPTIYTQAGFDAVVASAQDRQAAVHVKVDTGMHRVGAPPPQAVALAIEVSRHPQLRLEGFWTHLAVADQVDDPFTGEQLDRFAAAVADLAAAGLRPPMLHVANSAATLWHPEARFDMVRCGIALYGLSPAPMTGRPALDRPALNPPVLNPPALEPPVPDRPVLDRPVVEQLRPALALKARVSYVKRVEAGERLSYGLRYRLERSSVIATVPLGYADGVTRRLSSSGGEVLIGGRRCPIAGAVTMDQIVVDCGPDAEVATGDEVVLIGRQGAERIDAWDWAARIETIAYEVVCGLSGRVPRVYTT